MLLGLRTSCLASKASSDRHDIESVQNLIDECKTRIIYNITDERLCSQGEVWKVWHHWFDIASTVCTCRASSQSPCSAQQLRTALYNSVGGTSPLSCAPSNALSALAASPASTQAYTQIDAWPLLLEIFAFASGELNEL